ncbi:Thromboxane-A synthase [Desmophyllum pertusum]|uniref:Thromboxane-A synthase n=1 Tax=Desmophyllum pertusum TaxID=174260 RepID=A0A9W9YXL9_9CNID|nr:Thromboxane-A synthase [Desmophyllum pertusum]
MLDWFSKLTLEVILSTAFGVDANIQMGENTEMLEKAKAVFRVPFIVRQIARLPFGSSLLLLLLYLRGSQMGYFEGVAKEIIKTRRQQGLTGRKDLIHLMMMANDETTVEGVSRLSDDEIVAQAITFLLAGYETSSNTQAEDRDQRSPGVHAKQPLYDVAQNIEYLDCVVKESQRLNPVGAGPNRECSKDYDLNDEIHIPAGTEIVIPIYALHHDPDAWEDPEKFDPERFRGPAKDARHAYQFLPFSAGPRNCIGMRFALMEIKIALVRILMKYKFVQSPETQVPLVIHPGITLCARDGVSVRVESMT